MKACRITLFASTLAAVVVMALLPVGLAASPQALAQTSDTLDGWGQFKFGMTLDQVQALPPPGQPWMRLKVLEDLPDLRGIRSLTSAGPVKEFGADFGVIGLILSTDKGLEIILLHSEKSVR